MSCANAVQDCQTTVQEVAERHMSRHRLHGRLDVFQRIDTTWSVTVQAETHT
jgi:hypothetical protein